MNPKWMLLLYGALMVLGAVCGDSGGIPSMSDSEKRRVIRSMLEAQKDIRKALFKIRKQIEGDLNSTGHNGAQVPEDSDEDDFDDVMGGEEMSGEEEEEYYKERQKKIREARELLEKSVKQIGSSLIAIKKYIERIDKKVDEAIAASREKHYTANYHFNPGKPHGHNVENSGGPTAPIVHQTVVAVPQADIPASYSIGYYKNNFGVFKAEALTAATEDEPFRPMVAPKRNKKPGRKHRTDRSLEETVPTVVADQLSSPDIPSVVGYDGPVQKTVEYQMKQQQIQQ
ncbi:AAEL004584-PA [Aedes aegypti]|uniref:AAEL004584-PA n=1 Tax=Aedes aegypti TaxID=7159 RepID=Q17CD9_AEDAE|nr:AAEL004584-PA [Aedes aegypti]